MISLNIYFENRGRHINRLVKRTPFVFRDKFLEHFPMTRISFLLNYIRAIRSSWAAFRRSLTSFRHLNINFHNKKNYRVLRVPYVGVTYICYWRNVGVTFLPLRWCSNSNFRQVPRVSFIIICQNMRDIAVLKIDDIESEKINRYVNNSIEIFYDFIALFLFEIIKRILGMRLTFWIFLIESGILYWILCLL